MTVAEWNLEREKRIHKALLTLCDELSKQRKAHAPFAFSTVVPDKPMPLDEARGHVRPEDFEQMQALSPDGTGFYVRRKVWRDAVIDALVSKATATKMAVASLADAGFGADAYALMRNLFENVIVVAWLLRPKDDAERGKRIDTYAAHFEAFKVRLDEVMRALAASVEEDAPTSRAADLRAAEIAAEVFQDKWMYWSWFRGESGKQKLVRLKDMVDEVGYRTLYDRDYFEMSAFVHSAPASIFGWNEQGPAEVASGRGHFAIEPQLFRAPGFATQALGLSNLYFMTLLIELDIAFKWGLDVERIRISEYKV